jgi:hypothetical protein
MEYRKKLRLRAAHFAWIPLGLLLSAMGCPPNWAGNMQQVDLLQTQLQMRWNPERSNALFQQFNAMSLQTRLQLYYPLVPDYRTGRNPFDGIDFRLSL